jgi:hypothetical protein
VKLDPAALLTRTFEHLKRAPEGHVLVGITQFVLINVFTFGLIFCGMCGGFLVMIPAMGAAAASGADPEAAEGLVALLSLLVYPLLGLLFALLVPALTMVYSAYGAATLDEVDGKAKVSLGAVGSILAGSVGGLLLITAIQCSASVVGLLLCYVGIFLTALPFRWAFLIKHDRRVGTMDALGLAWDGFRADPASHAVVFVMQVIISLVLAYIPLLGPMIVWPVIAVFDAIAYRTLNPATLSSTTPAAAP